MKDLYKVKIGNFFASQLRGIPFFRLRKLTKESEKHELGVSFSDLELHYMAGGSPENFVDGLKCVKELGMKAETEGIAALELALSTKKSSSLREWLLALHAEGIENINNAPFPD